MKSTSKMLLFAAIGCALAASAFAFAPSPASIALVAGTGLAMAYLFEPVFKLISGTAAKAVAAFKPTPGGRSPAVLLIAAKAHVERMFTRKHITVTGSWRLCTSV
jgi:hypothetical protein